MAPSDSVRMDDRVSESLVKGQMEKSDVAAAASTARRPMLRGLDFLRFLSALHIVCFHFFKNSANPVWNRFAEWGGAQLTFFFMLSGFTLAYQYTGREEKMDEGSFWWKRFARLYPMYIISVILECLILPRGQVTATQLGVMALSLQTWVSWAFENPINTPSWTIGAFLMLYAVFPTALRMLRGSGKNLFLVWYAMSAMQALNAMGHKISIYASINAIIFSAHVPSFLMGVILGVQYAVRPDAVRTTLGQQAGAFVEAVGSFGSLAGLLCIFALVDVNSVPFLHAWGSNGLLAPLMAVLIWCTARQADAFSRTVLTLPGTGLLGRASFSLYILQTAVRGYTEKFLCNVFDSDSSRTPCDLGFVLVLVFVSVVAHTFVETPLARVLNGQWVPKLRIFGPQPPLGYATAPGAGDGRVSCAVVLSTVGYYLLFCAVAGLYFVVSTMNLPFCQWEQLASVRGHPHVELVLNVLKWLAVAATPALAITTVGHLRWAPTLKQKYRSVGDMIAEGKFANCRLRFRYVTRGKYPLLIKENVDEAIRILRSCPDLPPSAWMIEVATDNSMDLSARCPDPNVSEIVVPQDYHIEDELGVETKYKARALHYAIEAAGASRGDWIVHLDEETRFDHRTIQSVLAHAIEQNEKVRSGQQEYGHIGQGVILYGTSRVGPIQNWITTLADSIRVADDFGKFRLQYELHEPLIGMHGSFVVASHAVEQAVGFNAGGPGSITEDAHFALMARGKFGVKFQWMDSYMYEQSPFNIKDFIMQRRRWFGGLWLVCRDSRIPVAQRAGLAFMSCTWAFSFFVGIAMFLCMIVNSEVLESFRLMLAVVAALSCWGYVLGFVLTFRVQDGICRYIVLFYLQLVLQPLFALMEIAGVTYAITNPVTGFFIVKKETKAMTDRAEDAAAVGISEAHRNTSYSTFNSMLSDEYDV